MYLTVLVKSSASLSSITESLSLIELAAFGVSFLRSSDTDTAGSEAFAGDATFLAVVFLLFSSLPSFFDLELFAELGFSGYFSYFFELILLVSDL